MKKVPLHESSKSVSEAIKMPSGAPAPLIGQKTTFLVVLVMTSDAEGDQYKSGPHEETLESMGNFIKGSKLATKEIAGIFTMSQKKEAQEFYDALDYRAES